MLIPRIWGQLRAWRTTRRKSERVPLCALHAIERSQRGDAMPRHWLQLRETPISSERRLWGHAKKAPEAFAPPLRQPFKKLSFFSEHDQEIRNAEHWEFKEFCNIRTFSQYWLKWRLILNHWWATSIFGCGISRVTLNAWHLNLKIHV